MDLADKVVYTGMLDAYFSYCFGKLEYRSLRFENEILDIENYQGVAVMNMKPKFRMERVAAVGETGIVNHSRYRVRSVPAAGALLKTEDSDEKQMELL